MMSLSADKDAEIIEAFNSTSRYEGQSKCSWTLPMRSHLLNDFKSHFIFRKCCFHSLN